MAVIVGYHPETKVVNLRRDNENPSDWVGVFDVLVDPDESAIVGVPERFWIAEPASNAVREATQAEKDSISSVVREEAKEAKRGFSGIPMVLRAFAEIVLSEINILRNRANLPPRTIQQLKNQIDAIIDNGTVDED